MAAVALSTLKSPVPLAILIAGPASNTNFTLYTGVTGPAALVQERGPMQVQERAASSVFTVTLAAGCFCFPLRPPRLCLRYTVDGQRDVHGPDFCYHRLHARHVHLYLWHRRERGFTECHQRRAGAVYMGFIHHGRCITAWRGVPTPPGLTTRSSERRLAVRLFRAFHVLLRQPPSLSLGPLVLLCHFPTRC